jgi:threonine/homoserine/homoserine lactone efflux protein
MLTYLLQGLTFGFAAAVQPGPFQAYLISHTLRFGWRKSLLLALVPLCSDLPIIALVVLILKGLPDSALLVLRIGGGAFLLLLAYNALRTAISLPPEVEDAERAAPGFLQAVLTNLLNPNVYLYWGFLTGPILITGWKLAPENGIAFLLSFYIIMTLVVVGILMAFGMAGRIHTSVRRGMILVSAAGLAGFGVYQLWMGLQTLFFTAA